MKQGKMLGINVYNNQDTPAYAIQLDGTVREYREKDGDLALSAPIGVISYKHGILYLRDLFGTELGRITLPTERKCTLEQILNENQPIKTQKGEAPKDVFEFLKAESSS